MPEESTSRMDPAASDSISIEHAALKKDAIRRPFAEFSESLLEAILDSEKKLKEDLSKARAEQLELSKQFTKVDAERQISAMHVKRIQSERALLERERRRVETERRNVDSYQDSLDTLREKLLAIKSARGDIAPSQAL